MANWRKIEPYWWNSLISVFTFGLFNRSQFGCG